MVAVPSQSTSPDEAEQRLLLLGISWEQYEQFLEILEERPGVHLTYLRGALEIMTTSREHERIKKILARLMEAYAGVNKIYLDGHGQQTFRKKAKQRGIEPDECYMVGREKRVPDLAIEVVLTSWKVDKLEVYRGLGIHEVWVHRHGALTVHLLEGNRWIAGVKSRALPAIDLALLQRFALPDAGQTELAEQYRAALRAAARRAERRV